MNKIKYLFNIKFEIKFKSNQYLPIFIIVINIFFYFNLMNKFKGIMLAIVHANMYRRCHIYKQIIDSLMNQRARYSIFFYWNSKLRYVLFGNLILLFTKVSTFLPRFTQARLGKLATAKCLTPSSPMLFQSKYFSFYKGLNLLD